MRNTPSLLIIDDDRKIAEIVATVAREAGFAVRVASSDHLPIHEALHPDVIVLDLIMPERDGLETMQLLRTYWSNARVVILSGQGEGIREMAERMAQAMELSVVENIAKPFRISDLRQRLLSLRASLRPDKLPAIQHE